MKARSATCPIEYAMSILSGRWRIIILHYLLDGPKRFSDLRRDMPLISQRMLTLDLRALEQAGLIRRTIYPEVPVRVEYELTPEGHALRCAVEELERWGSTQVVQANTVDNT
jgi:DNA-binding HxlR family transcriptional regulator